MSSAENWRNITVEWPAYIVLDIPSPTAEKIQEFRKRFDPDRANLPAEITLTGSCGTGLVSFGQTLGEIADKIELAAKQLTPFHICFDHIDRFPETDIYFLTVKDSPALLKTQKIISECGIKFDPTPYPYHPHCTIALRKEIKDDRKLMKLFFLDIPKENIILNTLSVYALHENNTCDLLYKLPFGN